MVDQASILLKIKEAKKNALMMGGLVVGAGVVLILIGAYGGIDKAGALGVLTFLWGLVTLFGSLGSAENARFYVLISKTPERIVWAYLKETRGMEKNDLRRRDVVIGSDDGKTAELPTKTKEEATETLAFVQGLAPKARIGYDAALEAQFKQQPSSLKTP